MLNRWNLAVNTSLHCVLLSHLCSEVVLLILGQQSLLLFAFVVLQSRLMSMTGHTPEERLSQSGCLFCAGWWLLFLCL